MESSTRKNSNKKTNRKSRGEDLSTEFEGGYEMEGQSEVIDGSVDQEMSAKTESQESQEPRSVGAVIAQSLAKESQQSFDKIGSQISQYFRTGSDYVSTNPREALMIAVSAGMAAWALLATKPGRKLFDAGAAVLVPEVSRWAARNFSSAGSSANQQQH